MDIQNIKPLCNKYGKLQVSWETTIDVKGHVLAISSNTEFTERMRYFVLPAGCQSVAVDCGSGLWFVRIGGFVGSPDKGHITWSGIVGPVAISSEHTVITLPASVFSPIHTQPIVDGFRIHTGLSVGYYAILEYSTDSKFPASLTKSQYTFDKGRGYVDCIALNPDLTYSVRIIGFNPEFDKLPVDTIKLCGKPMAFHGKKPSRPLKHADSTAHTLQTADAAILRDIMFMPKKQFTSHGDYLRYKAALERNAEHKTPTGR